MIDFFPLAVDVVLIFAVPLLLGWLIFRVW